MVLRILGDPQTIRSGTIPLLLFDFELLCVMLTTATPRNAS